MNARSLLQRTEVETGMRFCRGCNGLVPLDQFPAERHRHTCTYHTSERRRKEVLGTPEKRAFNSIRCRARKDMIVFGHQRMFMGIKQVMSLMSAEQLADYKNFALVPIVPSQPISKCNVAVIGEAKRKALMANWKATNQDDAQYGRSLGLVINMMG